MYLHTAQQTADIGTAVSHRRHVPSPDELFTVVSSAAPFIWHCSSRSLCKPFWNIVRVLSSAAPKLRAACGQLGTAIAGDDTIDFKAHRASVGRGQLAS
uniref:Transposase n=1 Tax=Steinernema glaseri TaxID=37863 RepID=A0A1I7Y3R1_9BILA